MSEAATERLAEAIGELMMAGIALNVLVIALGVFLAIVLFKLLVWLIKLPFKLIQFLTGSGGARRNLPDYGYNTIYDTNDKWEYNEKKHRWEPMDKSRIRHSSSKRPKPAKRKTGNSGKEPQWEFNEATGLWEPKDKSRML